jgi:hypothetical protein
VRSDEERLPSEEGHRELVETSFCPLVRPQILVALTFEASVAPT